MITVEHSGCIVCAGCAAVCPFSAIELIGNRIKVYGEKCTDCGICVKVCPADVIEIYRNVKDVKDLPEEKRKKI